MAAIRFGTSSGPCKTASAAADLVEEFDSRGNCDPDKLVQCPFDKNHQIRACRFPYHLIKCKKNHPELASKLKTCPFNARHLVPKHELTHHIETCEHRVSLDMEPGASTNGHRRWSVPLSTWVNPDLTEDWDKEADDGGVPFVWGEHAAFNVKPEARATNHLGPNIRVPNTLPWPGSKF